jgi:hypothetical protein
MNELCEQCKVKIECALRNTAPTFEKLRENPEPRHSLQMNRWAWNFFNDCLVVKDIYKVGGKYDY